MSRWALVAGVLAGVSTVSWAVNPPATASGPLQARGEYLAKVGGCVACHTEPKHGRPFAGARNVPSPFGPIVSTNITPDKESGIGRYTFADFERALRKGVAPGGRHLYPAMPYTAYAKMSQEDMQSLYVYLLEAVEPVPLKPPETKLDFPFNQRWVLRFWKAAFVPRGVYEPNPGRSAEWNRGAYLVQSVAHCGSCHTPRGIAYQERGGDESDKHFLAGAKTNDWYAKNLAGDTGSGLGRTDREAIAAFLKTGQGGARVAYGTMAETVEDSLQYLSDEDALAIASYLKTLPPRQPTGSYQPGGAETRPVQAGNHNADTPSTGWAVYAGFCVICHQPAGEGVPPGIPALAGNPGVLSKDATSLIRLVLEGGRGAALDQGPPPTAMPAFGSTLSDVEIALVLSHLREAWGNQAQPVSTNDVATMRKKLHR